MEKYDLNKRGFQVTETVLQFLGSKGKIYQIFQGPYYGAEILDFDFECQSDDLYNDCRLRLLGEEDYWTAELHDKDGDTLFYEGDSQEFNDIIVKNEIIGQFENREEAHEFVQKLLETKQGAI